MKEYKGFLVDEQLNIYSKRTGLRLTPYKGSDGYLHVQYRDATGKSKHERVHVIYGHTVVENPKPDEYHYINHKDSNKLNCDPSNLEWTTNSENVKHGWHSGNRTHRNNTRVSVSDGNYVQEFKSIRQLAETLHLDRHKVARVLKGELPPHCIPYTLNYI